ncbi:hypothetical protein KAX02_05365 [candidate division WOR-3 bacterium]|nr:hypothetical protein [candidate division WOR-3 bacterium]
MANLGDDYGDNVELCTGEAFYNRGSGEINLGNVKLFEVLAGKELHPIMSGRSNKAVDVKEYEDMQIKLGLDKHTWEILAELTGKTAADISGGTSPVVAEAVSLGLLDIYVSLAHGQGAESPVSAVVVKGVGGSPTYTENTDYKLKHATGEVAALTPLISTDVEIDYSYTTQTSKKLKFGKAAITTIGSIRYTHALQNGKVFEAKIYRAYIESLDPVVHGDTPTEFAATFRALQDDSQAGEELGYWTFTT